MVFRIKWTFTEITEILDTKYNAASSIGYNLPPGTYKFSDINLMLKSLIPNEIKVNVSIDDTRLRSNLTSNKVKKFTKTSFFYTKLCFNQSHPGALLDFNGFVQKFPCKYGSKNPITLP